MKLVVDRLETRRVDVRVDLRGGDAGMAEHLLHLPQVGAATEHVRGEAMPQPMRTHRLGRAGPRGELLQQLPDPLSPQWSAARRK